MEGAVPSGAVEAGVHGPNAVNLAVVLAGLFGGVACGAGAGDEEKPDTEAERARAVHEFLRALYACDRRFFTSVKRLMEEAESPEPDQQKVREAFARLCSLGGGNLKIKEHSFDPEIDGILGLAQALAGGLTFSLVLEICGTHSFTVSGRIVLDFDENPPIQIEDLSVELPTGDTSVWF